MKWVRLGVTMFYANQLVPNLAVYRTTFETHEYQWQFPTFLWISPHVEISRVSSAQPSDHLVVSSGQMMGGPSPLTNQLCCGLD